MLGSDIDIAFEEFEIVVSISINDRDTNIRIGMMLKSVKSPNKRCTE